MLKRRSFFVAAATLPVLAIVAILVGIDHYRNTAAEVPQAHASMPDTNLAR